MDKAKIIHMALAARESAYAPYSKYSVGAALLTTDGKIYCGCNIENAAYSVCNCAERTAFFTAVAAGEKSFKAIAIVGGRSGEKPVDYAYPCGVCRQVMNEFCNKETFEVIVAISEEDYKTTILGNLLPNGFGPDNLV